MAKTVTIDRDNQDIFVLEAKAVKAVSYAMEGPKGARYYLKGVFVEGLDAKNMARVTATDGHILLTYALDRFAHVGRNYDKHQEGTHGFILEMDFSEKSLTTKTVGDLWMVGNYTTGIIEFISVCDYDDDTHLRVGVCEFSQINGIYPDWRMTVPALRKEGDDHVLSCIGLDPRLLNVIGTAFKVALPKGEPKLHINFTGENTAMRITHSHEVCELEALLMPLRVSERTVSNRLEDDFTPVLDVEDKEE